MIENIIKYIAPHHCYLCEESGSVLCKSCVYNIKNIDNMVCIVCGKLSAENICTKCSPEFSRAWVAAMREGEISQIITDFKWQNKKEAFRPLTQLLHETLPVLPSQTVVVPIPTITKHKRIRGYDHCGLIAKELSRLRGFTYKQLLERKTQSVQHKASKKDRKLQADAAFCVNVDLDPFVPYLIVDDIVTTCSTMSAAAQVMKDSGALTVWVAAVARQPK